MGRVVGEITDSQHAVISAATITVESNYAKYTATSDPAGRYEFQVPAGVYQITADKPGFYSFRRARFTVQPGGVSTINMVILQRYLSIVLTVSEEGAEDRAERLPAPKYDAYTVPQAQYASMQLLVRFEKRRHSRDLVNYRAAMASYDALAIYADRMRIDKRALRLTAEGNVRVDDGKQRLRVLRAELEFSRGQPLLMLIDYSSKRP